MKPEEIRADSQITSPTDRTLERQVNLCCQVPQSWRRHWAAEAKRNGVTMTEVIREAFTARFGLPEDQNK